MEETADKSADEKKGGVSGAEILELIESLDKAQVAERVNALGVRRLISLQQAQGQPLTIEALKILAEWLEWM